MMVSWAFHEVPVMGRQPPTKGIFSKTTTLLPASASSQAAMRPAMPEPTTTASTVRSFTVATGSGAW